MTRDPRLTQTLEEPRERPDRSQEQDPPMRTTLVQPLPGSRHSELVRTHYWETRPSGREPALRDSASYAPAGSTGPDDPIAKAVQAAKQHLLDAERASHERLRVTEIASVSPASTAKTVVMPADEARQLMAASAPTSASRQSARPKRKLKTLVIAGATLAAIVCVATAGYCMPVDHARPGLDAALSVRPGVD